MSNDLTPASCLLRTLDPSEVFTVDDTGEEARELAGAARRFVAKEVDPVVARIEAREPGLLESLVKKAGALGLMGLEVPAEHGGLGADQRAATHVAESMAGCASFSGTVGLHAGIGIWPLVLFGSPEQRARHLPRMASGETMSSYCLTEPGSGSDAMSLTSSARPAPDGNGYILNGAKQFISNGALSGIFTVFARLPEAGVTAFLVEKGPGVTPGAEEHKLGLRGASTTSLALSDARGEMLGEPGKGHRIAFSCLNLGRLRIGAWCLGTSKRALALAREYAASRVQFGAPIASFGLIRQKLARMAVGVYALESMVYHTASRVDARSAAAAGESQDVHRVLSDSAVEASAAKIYGSEVEAFVVDEAVQIHGGYGFIEDYAVARMYRDARGNRLYEGTSEINRLLLSGSVLKSAALGKMPIPEPETEFDGLPHRLLIEHRAAFWELAVAALETHGAALEKEQELLGALSDAIIGIYALDTSLARARRSGVPREMSMVTLLALQLRDEFAPAARRILARLDRREPGGVLARILAGGAIPEVDPIGLAREVAS